MELKTQDFASTVMPAAPFTFPDRLGAVPNGAGQTRFLVWAPFVTRCEVHIVSPRDSVYELTSAEGGYFAGVAADCDAGARYFYRLDGRAERPDPASRSQPAGVHGPSEVVALRSRPATPGWRGIPLSEYILYELHVGTFTPGGTFDAAAACLDRLRALGVTAVELMPVAEFPGGRNWGYDGVFPFAAETAYGGSAGVARFVDACHERGMAAVLDVVYNHLGPEGNYLREFGPYFTNRHKIPWGDALNFDGPDSDPVRRFFIENALYWVTDVGFDALRLDAVHAIHDRSAYPFLRELADRVHQRAAELNRRIYLIAESDLNDSRLVVRPDRGGYGLDAQWSDEFHHCLHTLLTAENSGYYADFGSLEQFAKAMQQGWAYSGEYSRVRRRRFGNSPGALEGHQLVVFSQNHDQIGNRMRGERLLDIAGPPAARLAAAAVILSPYLPLLFMGEEYGDPAPFLYHVSHSDPELQEAVRRGRKQEFAGFAHQGEPPDPQDEATFNQSKLNQALAAAGPHALLHDYYQELLALRRSHPALRNPSKRETVVECYGAANAVVVRRLSRDAQAIIYLHFGREQHSVSAFVPRGTWRKVLDSTDERWGGPGVSPAPPVIGSSGEAVDIALPPVACVVYSGAIG